MSTHPRDSGRLHPFKQQLGLGRATFRCEAYFLEMRSPNCPGTSHNHQTLSALKQVKIFTDGACSGNPGPGGYGTIVVVDGVESELSQGYKRTTNNRMEIRAVLAGLESLPERCDVQVFSDSKYVVDSIKLNWAKGWKAKGWRRGTGEKALNPDLWAKMLDECARHKVTMNWVKGHAGHPENERCDELAVSACSSRDLLVDEGFEG